MSNLMMNRRRLIQQHVLNGKCIKPVRMMVMLVLLMTCFHIMMENIHAQQHVSVFQELGTTYKADSNVLSTYYMPPVSHLHGYLELSFINLTSTTCSYKVDVIQKTFKEGSNEVGNRNLQSLFQFSFVKCARSLTSFVKFRFTPEITKNVDPYTVNVYQVYVISTDVDSTINYGFTPFENTKEIEYGGPFEAMQDIDTISRNKNFQFAIYANDETKAKLDTLVPIYYSRDLKYSFPNDVNQELVISYNHAPVLNVSNTDQIPQVSVSMEYSEVNNPTSEYNVVLRRVKVVETNVQPNQELIEERSFTFVYENTLVIGKHTIKLDLSAITCAYDYGNGQLIYDTKVSIVKLDRSRYTVFCRESSVNSTYSLLIVAKRKYDFRMKTSADFGVSFEPANSKVYDFYLEHGNLEFAFSTEFEQTGGKCKVGFLDGSLFSSVSIPITNQKPLSLYNVIVLNVTEVVPKYIIEPMDYRQQVSFTLSNKIQDGIDPSSLRIAFLNESTKSFELYLPDDPIMGIRSWTYDIVMGETKTVSFGLFYYDYNVGILGESQTVSYSRTINYKVDDMVTLSMDYDISANLYEIGENEHKPYVVISERKIDGISNLGNFTIYKAFTLDAGNDLRTFAMGETRIFTVKSTTSITDIYGNAIRTNLMSMRCAYMFKESGYSTMELSPITPTFDKTKKIYTLNCNEGMSDEDYVLLLIVTPFVTVVNNQVLGMSYNVDSSVIGRYSSKWSENDFFDVEFSPDSTFDGIYSFSKNTFTQVYYDGMYRRPELVDTQSKMIAVYNLDLSQVKHRVGSVTLTLSKIGETFNFNPYSVRIFKFYPKSEEFKLVNEDVPYRGPWTISLVPPENALILIFASSTPIAKLGESYAISYARLLEYCFNEQATQTLTFSFSDMKTLAPTVSDMPIFKMVNSTKRVIANSYVTLHAFDISQTNFMNYGLRPTRTFKLVNSSETITDVNGVPLPNLDISTINCAYQLPDSIEILWSKSVITNNLFETTVTCSESFYGSTYSLFIIGKVSSPQPVPSPISPKPSPIPQPKPSPSPVIPSVSPIPSPPIPKPSPKPSPIPPMPSPVVSPIPSPTPVKSPTPKPSPKPSPIPSPAYSPSPSPKPSPIPSPVHSTVPHPSLSPIPQPKPSPIPVKSPTPISSPKPSPTPAQSILPPKPSPVPVVSSPKPSPIPVSPLPRPTPIQSPIKPKPSPVPVVSSPTNPVNPFNPTSYSPVFNQ